MSDNVTTIRIVGKVSYADEISIAQAAKIITFLNSDEAAAPASGFGVEPTAPERPKMPPTPFSKKVENPRDALDVSGASTNPEKIVALGAYVLQDGGDTFKVEDVKSQFRRARETPPANFTRDLGVAVSSGWIFEAEGYPGEYHLNSKIDPIFDGGFAFPKGSGGSGSRQRASRGKNGKPDTLSDIDEFRSTLDAYPNYAKMKSERDRLLWVLNYMSKKHNRKGLSNKEIVYISDHMGTGIPTNNVSGAFRSAKGPGYATRSTLDQTIKITEEGSEYLKSLGSVA